jgi:hypothetical protein
MYRESLTTDLLHRLNYDTYIHAHACQDIVIVVLYIYIYLYIYSSIYRDISFPSSYVIIRCPRSFAMYILCINQLFPTSHDIALCFSQLCQDFTSLDTAKSALYSLRCPVHHTLVLPTSLEQRPQWNLFTSIYKQIYIFIPSDIKVHPVSRHTTHHADRMVFHTDTFISKISNTWS